MYLQFYCKLTSDRKIFMPDGESLDPAEVCMIVKPKEKRQILLNYCF